MALYRDISSELVDSGLAREVYRFQGARTASRLDISKNNGDGYIYFSNSLDHHMYFTLKRIKQLLNTLLLREERMALNAHNLRGTDTSKTIKNLVLTSENLDDLFSHRLVCSKSFDGLIKDNFVYNEKKKGKTRYIERVDRRVCGGGYGICDEWKELLCYMTFFSAKLRISRNDLVELIRIMKTTGRMNSRQNMDFLLRDSENYMFDINPNILSDFNKYNIINALEAILEKGMALPDSELSCDSKKTIRGVVEEYERGREKTLEMLGKRKY